MEESKMTIKKDLLIMHKEIKALTKKIDKLLKDFIKIEETKYSKKSSKKTVKAEAAKLAQAKKAPAKKKAAKQTATDQVLTIINKSKKGVGVPVLKEMTGFDDKKIRNILYRAFKDDKIKRAGRGLYIVVK
jgi:uncharacterized protein YdaU (DUF1376 family)